MECWSMLFRQFTPKKRLKMKTLKTEPHTFQSFWLDVDLA